MSVEQEVNIHIHDPNGERDTARMVLAVFVEACRKKADRLLEGDSERESLLEKNRDPA